MTHTEIVKCLMVLEKWYPNFKVVEDPELYDGWKKRLENKTPVEVRQAIELIIENETYPPNPAVMKKYIDMIAGNDSNEIVALFKKAIRLYGMNQTEAAYNFIKKNSQIAYDIIKPIGFHALCLMDQEKACNKIHKDFRDKRAMMSSNVKAIEAKQDNQISLMDAGKIRGV